MIHLPLADLQMPAGGPVDETLLALSATIDGTASTGETTTGLESLPFGVRLR
jgi:hypothetical protein